MDSSTVSNTEVTSGKYDMRKNRVVGQFSLGFKTSPLPEIGRFKKVFFIVTEHFCCEMIAESSTESK